MTLKTTLDDFTRGYLEAALWTSDPEPGQGEWSEHDDWTIDNIDMADILRAIEVCHDFQAANADALAATGADDSRNGHDFYLTRCGHGSGFWDRDYGDVGKRLSDAAKVYGDVHVYGPDLEPNGSVSDISYADWDRIIHIDD